MSFSHQQQILFMDAVSSRNTQYIKDKLDDESLTIEDFETYMSEQFAQTDLGERLLEFYSQLLTDKMISVDEYYDFASACLFSLRVKNSDSNPVKIDKEAKKVALFNYLYLYGFSTEEPDSPSSTAFIKFLTAHKETLPMVDKLLDTVSILELDEHIFEDEEEESNDDASSESEQADGLKFKFYSTLMSMSLEAFNLPLIQHLKGYEDGQLFSDYSRDLTPAMALRLNQLLALSPQHSKAFNQYINQFVYDLGKIRSDGTQLFFAQKQAKVSVDSQGNETSFPVVLEPYEVDKFWQTIRLTADAMLTKPHTKFEMRKSFIIMGIHTIMGEVKISANDEISVVILDSLGANIAYDNFKKKRDKKSKKSAESDSSDDQMSDFEELNEEIFYESTRRIMDSCLKAFKDSIQIPVILYPAFERQRADKGCTVYAIRDTGKLQKFDLLSPDESLYEYCQKNVLDIVYLDSSSHPVYLCKLHPIFMPLAQSKSVFEELLALSPEEKQMIINNKGETVEQVSKKMFVNGRNTSNNLKLRFKWCHEVGDYLLKFIAQNGRLPKQEMESFTLKRFLQTAKMLRSFVLNATVEELNFPAEPQSIHAAASAASSAPVNRNDDEEVVPPAAKKQIYSTNEGSAAAAAPRARSAFFHETDATAAPAPAKSIGSKRRLE